ncbi:MAG: rubrerythrin [Pseudoflavonifractor sp.]
MEEKEECSALPEEDAFARVWRRVVPEDRPDCPFVLSEAAALPRLRVEVLPATNAPACLVGGAEEMGARLQEFIARELYDYRAYTVLARRVAGRHARMLTAIAAQEQRHAKRLATAYFILSGVRYLPRRDRQLPAEALFAALRGRYLAEQEEDAAYRAAAAHTLDPCLRALFQELSGQEADQAFTIRGIMEEI